ncbi:SGNH/GDSL hydrolase family protein [Pseudomonas umsongensis]|uniref:SGNH hydrolase-type esterase domain-containing protein n=1 Tax=Pseudomonas umsongensis TaxID=198618 RepID=A0AAE7DE48_9PSED|nr:SGNH/GDSL hydrolase family protein [Pseudomonas umsongensis]QJC78971.1 hypothetical protein HGP31_11840 [Pseudomonas umsongensis]
MADQTQRLDIATVKAEIGSDILSRFSNDAVTADPISTDSGTIPNLKQVIVSIQEGGAEKISFASTIYSTTAAGIAATTNGAIFLVKSDEADEIYAVWQNSSGVATDTGKRAMAAQAIQDAMQSATEAAQAAEDSADLATGRTARFLVSVATPPVIRDDGTPLQLGDRYVNTENQAEYIYKSSGWIVNESLEAIAAIKDDTDPANGAAQVGWDGETVGAQMSLSKKIADYAALRVYTGTATGFKITDANFSGNFILDPSDTVSADDKSTVIVGAAGRRYKRIYDGRIQAAWCEGASDSAIIQASIDAALREGKSEVGIDRDYICDTALTNRTNIRFVGAGSLSGDSCYRVRVMPEWAPTGREPFQDLIPAQHLRAFSAAPAPTVVIVGSSTGGWAADSIDTGGGVTPMLQRLLGKYNPEKNISFYNRCIGSQTFAALNSKPTSFPSWYTDTGRDWLQYIADLAPDTVYIICGSNDSSSAERPVIKSILDKLAAFAKSPDVVFFTQPSVCPDPDPAFASSGTRASQEGRDYAAGLVRSMARYYKKGLIDANRMGGIVLDGRDILDNASMRILPSIPVTSGRFAPGLSTIDFSMSLNFNGSAAANDAAFLVGATNPVFVKTGAVGANSDSGDIAYIQKTAEGFLRVQLYSDGLYQTLTTGVVFPTTSFTLDVIKVGNVLTLSFNGSEDIARVSFNIIAAGGEMYPRTGYYNLTSGPWTSVVLNVGLPKLYKKLLTSQEAWGLPNPAASRQMPYGGNGLNHLSSLGTREIYGRVMDTPALRGVNTDFGEYSPGLTPGTGTPTVTAPVTWAWTRNGNIVHVDGVVSVSLASGSTCSFSATLPIVPAVLNQDKTIALIMSTGAGQTGAGFGDPANKVVQITLQGASPTAAKYRVMLSYRLS